MKMFFPFSFNLFITTEALKKALVSYRICFYPRLRKNILLSDYKSCITCTNNKLAFVHAKQLQAEGRSAV